MIIVECNLDEFFIKNIGFSKKKIKHESGKGDVLRIVNKKNNVIGMIDEDPGKSQPVEMKQYKEKETMHTAKLFERKDDNGKKVIQLSPYLEHWLLHRARKNRISPNDFGLPEDPIEFHDITHIERKINFQKFLNELIQVDEEISTIKKWINEAIR
ncbi:MAG: hypothetical protein KKA10_03840 [Euryarchaeota archaeon]|nr:hypothetical protein [Euryarchaeota archaeon]MCG2737558.1 hypothetical protein [Candidatus Methanoperedenaceae archaeon]